jgi:Rrf2 family protein
MLTRSGTHALRAMVILAEAPTSYRGTQEVARRAGAPRNYLGKILQQLARNGLLESQKGLGGGFRLARAPESISLFEIIASLEDVDRWSKCVLGRACSDDNPCVLHDRWVRARDAYLDMLNRTNVAELAGIDGDWDLI